MPEIFYRNNQLVFIYYIKTIERQSPIPAEWTTKIDYDKIGIHILNLDDYTFEDFRIFDLRESSTEKIKNIVFREIKILPAKETDKRPIIYIGGKSNGNDCLYKLELDETLEPIPTPQKQILTAVNIEAFPEKVAWDFLIDIETVPGSAVFHFIGFEKDSTGKISRYYYDKEIVN